MIVEIGDATDGCAVNTDNGGAPQLARDGRPPAAPDGACGGPGAHPWLRTDGSDLRVRVESDAVLRLRPDLIPTADLEPVDERDRPSRSAPPGRPPARRRLRGGAVPCGRGLAGSRTRAGLRTAGRVRGGLPTPRCRVHRAGDCLAGFGPARGGGARGHRSRLARGGRTAARLDELVVDDTARCGRRGPASFEQLMPFGPLPD